MNAAARFVTSPIRPGDDVDGLIEAVAAVEPETYPSISDGTDTTAAWFNRKRLNASWLAWSEDGQVIGHVGLRLVDALPDGAPAPEGRTVELARLLVHPDHRRTGIARELITAAGSAVRSDRLWASTVVKSESFEMFIALGWGVAGTCTFVDDPRPGAILIPDVQIDARA